MVYSATGQLALTEASNSRNEVDAFRTERMTEPSQAKSKLPFGARRYLLLSVAALILIGCTLIGHDSWAAKVMEATLRDRLAVEAGPGKSAGDAQRALASAGGNYVVSRDDNGRIATLAGVAQPGHFFPGVRHLVIVDIDMDNSEHVSKLEIHRSISSILIP